MAGTWGTDTLQSFTPNSVRPEVLEKTLIGRRDLVDRLEELAIDGAGGPNKFQRLIIGPRGSGKSHLLKVLHNRLWGNVELRERLLIVFLLEDELGVASYLDFVMRMLRAIRRWYPDDRKLRDGIEKLYDLPLREQERSAVNLFLETVGEKDVLVIVENLGITFDEVGGFGKTGQQALRDLIQSHPRFMFFASSQALFNGVSKEEAPFSRFFKVTHLTRLTLAQAMEFLRAIAAAHERTDLSEYLGSGPGRGRMEAIYEFTGGNHRLLVTFFDFLEADSVAKLSEIFADSLNALRPYYQEQMRRLSAQQQKIVQYLSLERQPRTVKEIARACMVAQNTLSRQLKDLHDLSFVSRVRKGRESYYEIAEALFRICYEAELEQEGAPVRLFVDFLGGYYTAKELQHRLRIFQILGARFGNDSLGPFVDEVDFYERAIASHYPDFSDYDSPCGATDDDIEKLISDLVEESAFHEFALLSKHLKEEKNPSTLLMAAKAHRDFGRFGDAIETAKMALEIEPNSVSVNVFLSLTYARRPEDRDAAQEHAKRANELAPDALSPRVALGLSALNADRIEEALGHFEAINQLGPDNPWGWCLTGSALRKLDRSEEAEMAYRKALEQDADNSIALEALGALVGKARRYEEALTHLEALIALRPGYSHAWRLKGLALESLQRLDEAEVAYHKALECNAEDTSALEALGILAHSKGRHEGARNFFKVVNRLRPDYSRGWRLTSSALARLGRCKEAETACRRSLELDDTNVFGWSTLIEVLEQSDRAEEAREAYDKAVEMGIERVTLLISRAEARRNRRDYELAISYNEDALRENQETPHARWNIVSSLLGLDRIGDALDRLGETLKADAADPDDNVAMVSLHENCMELLEHAPTDRFAAYLVPAIELLERYGRIEQFVQSLSLTVFALLRRHERIDTARFRAIRDTFEKDIGERVEARVAVKFLDVGIAHFKKNDDRALLRLAREERRVFCKELDIEFEG